MRAWCTEIQTDLNPSLRRVAIILELTVCTHIVIKKNQTAAHQHFVVDALCEWKPLKDLTEELEHLRRVLGLDLAFEAIHLIHVICFMVT